jgi:Tetratricopeptide repeat
LPREINASQLFRLALAIALACAATSAFAQNDVPAEQLFSRERWAQLAQLLCGVQDRSAEQEYEYGVALAHLQRWDGARVALLRGSRLRPNDKRFPIELAGIAFKEKNNRRAAAYLERALRLDATDDYANEFLATVYFLEGNLEGAVKYWNRLSQPKPKISELHNEPALQVRPALLDHALAFSPASVLKLQQLRKSDARLRNMDIFANYRVDLVARPDGSFDSVFRAQELNGFGNGRMEAIMRALRGLPFQEVTPDYYNLKGSATNIVSLARWDPDKRRYSAAVSGPLGQNPQWRYHIAADFRNENWAVRNGFTGPAPVLASLNLRREAGVAEISRVIGWRTQWLLGIELSQRDYRSVVPGVVLTPQLLAQGLQLKQTARVSHELLRSPEHRLNLAGTAASQAARLWSQPGQSFEKLQASVEARWLPQMQGDDFETQWRVGGGKTFGQIPFDELFMLGLERDNDPGLWMRAHIGTRGGRKGSAPLGRDYILSNWESTKNVYSAGFVTIKVAPFVDTGKMTDTEFGAGTQKWLWDTGVEGKLKVLGVGVALVYGKDLRTGNNAFYVTLGR